MSGLILIIEDEEDLVSMLEYNLEKEGYQTRSAVSGEQRASSCRSGTVT